MLMREAAKAQGWSERADAGLLQLDVAEAMQPDVEDAITMQAELL
jgi:hypothetical protein